jgi:hypothetical protein
MIEITNETYRDVAAGLTESISDSDFFNGTIEFDFDEFYAALTITAILHRRNETYPEGLQRVTVDIIPVWWEFSTVQEQGEVLNDFSFSELKKYILQ